VENPEDYFYSSAKDYSGQKGLVKVILIWSIVRYKRTPRGFALQTQTSVELQTCTIRMLQKSLEMNKTSYSMIVRVCNAHSRAVRYKRTCSHTIEKI
jgi:hypothetical protein